MDRLLRLSPSNDPTSLATLTIAAAGAGMKATSGAPREMRNTDEEEIREHGFERFIRGHVENTHMAFDADILQRASRQWSVLCPMRCGKDKQVRSSIAITTRRGAPGIPSAMRRK